MEVAALIPGRSGHGDTDGQTPDVQRSETLGTLLR